MAKIEILKVVEVSDPQLYDIKDLRWEDLYVRVLKLSEAQEICRYIRRDGKPFVIIVNGGVLDDEVVCKSKERMRLFCVFTPAKWRKK